MAAQATCTWIGASGKEYIYDVHARHPKLRPNEPGNYIYAKLDEHRRWVPIYVGEGNLTQRAAADPRSVECIDAKGATPVHVHVNYDRDDRLAEQKDLLENFPQAYSPDGCNEKKGS
ncbi:MAG: hypothetical protein ACLQIQ_08960 [Beijerinckiaceae bacterium]